MKTLQFLWDYFVLRRYRARPHHAENKVVPTTMFEVGQYYRVLCDFSGGSDKFHSGEVLRFIRSGYDRYDGMKRFFFVDTQGIERTWDLYDTENRESWRELFERTLSHES